MSRTEAAVHQSLDRINRNSPEIANQLNDAKYIIFSDHHRGNRDGADDFLNNEETYIRALNHYLEQDYSLILLGDVEELWENPLRKVMNSYQEVLALEKRFSDNTKLIKIWGNHDDLWKVKHFLKKHLGPIFSAISVQESVILSFYNGEEHLGNMLLVHGHQGSRGSDRFSGISRFFVRHFWRNFQRIFKMPLSTPAKNIRLKSAHDMIMFEWANKLSRQIILCGHTHQPVFMSFTHADFLENKIRNLSEEIALSDQSDKEHLRILHQAKNNLEEELRRIKKDYNTTTLPASNFRKPCYFNSGCCSFSDGDITGIEVENGRIKLVKWSLHSVKDRILLEDYDLKSVFEACQ